VAVSPDGRTLLLGDLDGSVQFVDRLTGARRSTSSRHEGAVVTAAFAENGRVAVTASKDGRMIVWDVRSVVARDIIDGRSAPIVSLRISPDGTTLYSSHLDGNVIVWDLAGDRRLGRPFATGSRDGRKNPRAPSYDLSPDGRVLAVGHDDGTVTLTDVVTLREIATFPAVPKGPVFAVAFVPGSRILVVSGDRFLAGVDTGDGYRVTPLPGHEDAVWLPTISSDGRRMATTGAPGAVRLWDLRAGLPIGRSSLHHLSDFSDVALSPDGRTLAVLLPGTGIELVDAATLRSGPTMAGSETALRFVRFTDDGRHIIADAGAARVRVWSVETGRPVGTVYVGSTEELLLPAMSPDHGTLAIGGLDGTIRLFDMQTGRSIGTPLPSQSERPVAPLFTPDGDHLLAVSLSGPAYRWDLRPASWARHACKVAGRTLTRAEWSEVLPGRDYAPACG
jgi:WD40 repeat protein